MKANRLAALLLLAIVLPCTAQQAAPPVEQAAGTPAEADEAQTILGRWYVQRIVVGDDDRTPVGISLSFVFEEDGGYLTYSDNDLVNRGFYGHDAESATLELFDVDIDGALSKESDASYSFEDGMLIVIARAPGSPDARIEMSRNAVAVVHQPAEAQAILGRWELRSMTINAHTDEPEAGDEFVMVFEDNGRLTVRQDDAPADTYLYAQDPERGSIELYPMRDGEKQNEVELVLDYHFVDGSLVIAFRKEGDNFRLVLARGEEHVDAEGESQAAEEQATAEQLAE